MRTTIDWGTRPKYKYECDNCNREIDIHSDSLNNHPIVICFPYPHSHDTSWPDGQTIICSDSCAIEFFQKSIQEHGEFKADLVIN